MYLFSGSEHGTWGYFRVRFSPQPKRLRFLPVILILSWSTATISSLILYKKLSRSLQMSSTVTCGVQINGQFSMASKTGLSVCLTTESFHSVSSSQCKLGSLSSDILGAKEYRDILRFREPIYWRCSLIFRWMLPCRRTI